MHQIWSAMTPQELTDVKLHLLSNGITFNPGFLESYRPEFIEKRWAYGNSDQFRFKTRIPQEVLMGNLVAPVHYVPNSSWSLAAVDNKYVLCHLNKVVTPVSFPLRPKFYDATLSDGTPCDSVGTLYGGGSLGIFALGTCYYFRVNKACGFCSLEPTRSAYGDHIMDVKPDIAAELTEIVLHTDPEIVKQIMLNGGNRHNNDIGFLRHLTTLKLLCEKVSKAGREKELEVHLITMPPDNLGLLEGLRSLPIKISMNLEVFSPNHFKVIAPGKATLYGREKLIRALEKAVEVLGQGNVYTIFVGGLEPVETLTEGLAFVAERGIVPIINVFHRDPEARLSNHPRPSVQELQAMGKALQGIFDKYGFEPFYKNCGRNSLDGEAFYGYFE